MKSKETLRSEGKGFHARFESVRQAQGQLLALLKGARAFDIDCCRCHSPLSRAEICLPSISKCALSSGIVSFDKWGRDQESVTEATFAAKRGVDILRVGERKKDLLCLRSCLSSPVPRFFLPPSNQDISPDNIYFSKLARMLRGRESE